MITQEEADAINQMNQMFQQFRFGDKLKLLLEQAGGHIIQDDGSDQAKRDKLNFTGAGVSLLDNPANNSTDINIAGGGGGGGGGITELFKVKKNSNQVVANPSVGALVTWDVESFDEGGNFDLANNKFVAPVDGIYFFGGQLFFDYTGDANDHPLWAQLSDGVGLYEQIYHSTLARNEHRAQFTQILQLTAGQDVLVSFSGAAVECTIDVSNLGGAVPDFGTFYGLLVKDLS